MNWTGSSKLRLWAYVAIAVLLTSPAAHSAQFFRDDFEDGSATDGSPVTWIPEVPPFPVGDARVENGSLVLTPIVSEFYPDYWETDWEVESIFPADLTLRSQVRALGPGFSYQGIYARDTQNVDARQGVVLSALLTSSGTLAIFRGVNGVGASLVQRTIPELNSTDRDILLEFRLLGNQASVFAWPEGSPRPNAPQVRANFLPAVFVTEGRVGLFAGQEDKTPFISSAFRFFEVAPIPEPSALSLAGIAAVLLLGRRQRRQ